MFRWTGAQNLLREENKPPDEGGGGGSPKTPFTDEQLAAIGQTVNAAVTSHLKRQPAFADQLKSVDWKATLGPVLSDLLPKPDEGGSGGGDKTKGGKADDAVAKQLKELADKLEASEKRAVDLEKARSDAESQRAMDRAQADLRNALQPSVRPELLDVLVDHLAVSKGRLKVGESGPTLTVKKAPYKGAPEQDEDLPLAEAVAILLASEEAKVFLPAPSGGVPPRAGGAPKPGGGPLPKTMSSDPAVRTLQELEAKGIDPSSLFD